MPPTKYRAILLIDDDPGVRSAIAAALRTKGFIVVEATGRQGAEGMQLVRFDAIVTDLFMPDVDGLEIIRAARQHQEGVPVIALTGGASSKMPDLSDVARAMGAAATLQKPFELEELFEAIGRLLGESD